MPKRIKLLIDLSGINEGVSHLIYRSDSLPVPTEYPLIESEERETYQRPLSMEGEVLVQDVVSPFEFHVSRIFMMMPLPTVYIDGVMVANANIAWFAQDRKIRIDNEQIEPSTGRVITMDYKYLASVIEDDYTISQPGIIHHGSSVITGLNPPIHKYNTFDKLTKEYKIGIERDNTPHSAWYQVALREDLTGRLSELADPQQIFITPNLYDLKHRLEVSRDNKATWQHVIDFTGYDVILTNAADLTNYGHAPISVTVNRLSGEVAELVIQNPWHEWWNNTRPTYDYRVREEDTRNEVSDYAELPKGAINFKPTSMKIRRKEDNGTPAMFEGFDAIDMWTLTEMDVDITQPTITLTDDHLIAGRIYSYTFYIDDEEGLRSTGHVYIAPAEEVIV